MSAAVHRVMVIGGPGAGKSHLARALSNRLHLPVVSIDDLVYRDDGSVRPASEIDAAAIMAADNPLWIIEGGNTRTYAQRVAQADLLVRLCPPRWLRMLRVLRRGRVSRELLRWTWHYDAEFGQVDRQAVDAARAWSITAVELSRKADIDRFIAGFASIPMSREGRP